MSEKKVPTKQSQQKSINDDNMADIKIHLSMKRWPGVHQVYLVVQLGL
jgi:hypothetical protein